MLRTRKLSANEFAQTSEQNLAENFELLLIFCLENSFVCFSSLKLSIGSSSFVDNNDDSDVDDDPELMTFFRCIRVLFFSV